MSKKIKKTKASEEDKKFPLPVYNSEDDIYSRAKEVSFENRMKDEEGLAEDLDIPGAELDNSNEELGEEDEENNYYSLGGDDHDDLEEDTQ